MRKIIIYMAVLLASFIISSCADAGADQTAFSRHKVILDGSGSTPESGWKIVKYRWRQIRGKKVDLQDKNRAKAWFIAPDVEGKKRFTFLLTITEKKGFLTKKSTDSVTVTIQKDTEAPVITITGDNPYSLEAGNSFKDPGAKAVDNADGELNVSKSGEVSSKRVGEYKIKYSAVDISGNEANATRVVNVIDTTPPTIKILGDNPLILEYDSNFSDPGVKTSDNAEGNITVKKVGSVDTHTLGDYNITYIATDASGNEAKAIRVVKVIDSTPPVITLNGKSNISLFVGDTYTEEGASAVDNVDGELNVTISGSVNTNKEGNYTITYSAIDSSGNRAEAKRYIEVKKNPVTVQSITIFPQNIELRVKGEAAFKVLANLSNGKQQEIDTAKLSLTDSSLASIENSTIKGLQEGNTTLRAEFKNFSATANVAVFKELNTSNFNGAEFGNDYTDKIPPNATKEQYDQKRFCMITGRVVDENNQPLEGVKVWLLHHREYGSVSTDSNGTYVLPSEGGVSYIIRYQKEEYLIVDREFRAPIQDWAVVKEAQLLPKDDKATQIDLNASKVQVHSSTPTIDDRGERSTTLVFDGVSKATVTEADGTTRELKSFKVRATEFKTLKSMPKELPSKSAFTFCSDLTIDGVSDDANVSFDKPVVMYVENFLGFNVGEIVPIGYYDRQAGEWKPSKNGVVVKLLDTNNDGKVDALDSDGDNQPNDLNGDGSFSDEVAGIAGKDGYEAGKTYWRGEITHFTPWDFNWPYAPPPGAKPPKVKDPDVDTPPTNPEADCKAYGFSYVTVKGRVFHEDIPVAGTNLSLHYASDRVGNFKYAITANINTDELPDSVYAAKVEIFVAGQHYEKELHPGDDGHIEYVWNGKDATGRRVSGNAKATIKVTYLYPLVMYSASSDYQYAWNQAGSASTNIIGREKIEYSAIKTFDIYIDSKFKSSNIANGWSLSNFKKAETGRKSKLVKKVTAESLYYDISSITTDKNGNLYFVSNDWGSSYIKKIDAQGNLSSLYSIDAWYIATLEIDNLGNIYILILPEDGDYCRIEKIDKNGNITNIANIYYSVDFALDKKGNIFYTDYDHSCIKKIDKYGNVTNIAGNGKYGYSGDGNNSLNASLRFPSSIKLDNNGNIYFADCEKDLNYGSIPFQYYYKNCNIRKIDKKGKISTVAYNVGKVVAIEKDNLGNLFIADQTSNTIKQINTNNKIKILIGGGNKYSYNKAKPLDIGISNLLDIKLDQNNNLFFADGNKISKSILESNYNIKNQHFIKYNSDDTLNIYDKSGKILKTINLQTGKTLKKYEYDDKGHLTAIIDQFNQTIQIIRNERGYPTQIIAPNGQVTNLTVNSSGNLTEVSYEDGSKYQFSYYAGSLLKDMVDLGGHTIGHLYDKYGRFIKETLPNGGAYEFARNKEGNTTTYTQTFPEGEQRVIKDTKLPNGDINSTITLPSGDKVYVNYKNDYFNIESLSNGVKSVLNYTTDSFSKQKTILSKTITMPSGLSKTTSYNTTYDGNDTVINIKTQTITTNSKTTTITTNYQEGVESITSPMGKTITRSFDIDTLLTKELKFNNLEPNKLYL